MLRSIRLQARKLNIHEFQSQALLKKSNVSVARGGAADTAAGAEEIAEMLQKGGAKEFVIKAQILAGGRGLGTFSNGFKGGVHMGKTPGDIKSLASQMLGNHLITKQTGAGGALVNKVFVVEKLDVAKERYFAITMDRKFQGPVVIASAQGGTSIEDIAHNTPDAIIKEPVDIVKGMTQAQAEKLASGLKFSPSSQKEAALQIMNMYKMFIERDSTMLEINPFVETKDGRILALDAKINFDDNAAFRQKEVFELRDRTQEDPREVAADEHNLNYIGLDGSIACLVNGAGLAMSTMDIISLYGGRPANFLDVGGGADEKMVEAAFRLISSDPRVKAIFVNIFGGIMKCDVIARGILKAMETVHLTVPLVVRLQGTNMQAANDLIEKSGKSVVSVPDFNEAAKKVCLLAGIVKAAH